MPKQCSKHTAFNTGWRGEAGFARGALKFFMVWGRFHLNTPFQQRLDFSHRPSKATMDAHRAKCAILKACPSAQGLRLSIQVIRSLICGNRGAGYFLQRGEYLYIMCGGSCRLIDCILHCVTSFVSREASQSLTLYFCSSMGHVVTSIYAALRAAIGYAWGMRIGYLFTE
jgi:hypothetical protein